MPTPIYDLSEWAAAQETPWIPHNAALRVLEAVGRGSVLDRDLAAPPGTCDDGACYLIAAAATGAWAGYDGKLAVAAGVNAASGWLIATIATEGQFLYVEDEAARIQFIGGTWEAASLTSTWGEIGGDIADQADLSAAIAAATYTDEQARDALGAALVAGANVTITVDDSGDTITIDAAGGGGGGSYTDEQVRDVVGAALVAGTGIAITVDDSGDTITIDATGSSAGPRQIDIPAGAMRIVTTNGAAAGSVETATNKIMVDSLDFDAATQEYAQFGMAMPKSWDEGTVTAEFIWTTTGAAGAVVWGLQAVARGDGDAIDAAWGTGQEVTDTVLGANLEHHTAATAAITAAGSPAESDRLTFRAYRKAADGADTLTADAKLLGIRLTVTTNAATDA